MDIEIQILTLASIFVNTEHCTKCVTHSTNRHCMMENCCINCWIIEEIGVVSGIYHPAIPDTESKCTLTVISKDITEIKE